MPTLIGIIIAAFLFILLLLKRNKTQADLILTLWMGITLLHQTLHYVESSNLMYTYPHLTGWSFAFPLLQGVFLFLYVQAMISPKPLGSQWFHFIPFVVLMLLALPFYSLSGEEKIRIFEQEGKGYEWYMLLQLSMIMISGIFYVLWSLRKIYQYRKGLKKVFSDLEKRNLRWLELLTYGLAILWILVLFFDEYFIFSGVTIFVLFIGFYGINQVNVFTPNQIILPDLEENSSGAITRYAKSGLKAGEIEALHQQLQEKMKTEAWYKQADLTLFELANRLDVHPTYLSQVINEREGKNFYNYINTLRVNEFIRLASVPKNRQYTFLALAFDCGFNSKSTFNKYFKKITDQTPSQYFKK